jgi:hypothetical protein
MFNDRKQETISSKQEMNVVWCCFNLLVGGPFPEQFFPYLILRGSKEHFSIIINAKKKLVITLFSLLKSVVSKGKFIDVTKTIIKINILKSLFVIIVQELQVQLRI